MNARRLSIVLALASVMVPTGVVRAEPHYSLPWALQPLTSENLLRVDSTAAVFNDDQGNLDVAGSTVLAASYRMTTHWAPTLRLGVVGNNAPGGALDGASFVNPLAGATYARRMGTYRLALSWTTTIPLGMGGGDAPNVRAAKTNAASMIARPADAAMFEVNYLTESVGAAFAYVNHGFTAQGEATLQQAVRVRGSHSAGGTDPFRTSSVVGLHAGYFLGSHLSFGGDLRYQRWLSHPTSLDAMTRAHVPVSDANIDTLTVTLGVRAHLRLGTLGSIHPGISVTRGLDARGLDAPMITNQTTAVQIDVPVTF